MMKIASFRFILLLGIVLSQPVVAEHSVPLSAEEQRYLAQHPVIKACVDPDWAPFERINEQGQHEGIGADLLQLVAKRVGIKIELYPVQHWEESLAASKSGHCQIMSFLNQTPAREKWLIFTEPVFYDQNVIITREEHPFIGDLAWARDKTVALPAQTMVGERMKNDFPYLRLIATKSEAESMNLVSNRQADMTVRSLIVAAYEIKKNGWFNLKIAGQIPSYTNQLRIGVLKDEPILRDMLNKGVLTITPQEREAIVNQHVSIKIEQPFDYWLMAKIIAVSVAVLMLILWWNRKLRRLNQQLQQLNQKLATLSITDKLTGLVNRLRLDEVLAQEIQRSSRFGHVFSVILVDLDHFKHVNDTHGHQVGDQVLITAARLLQQYCREIDVVGRWGGEEFLIICPETPCAGAAKLAESLRQHLAAHLFPVVQQQTASFGVACYHLGELADTLLARADVALYHAKTQGRNQVVVD